jgi:hypothetical protein
LRSNEKAEGLKRPYRPKIRPIFTGFGVVAAYPVLTKWAVFWAVRLMWFPAPFATVNPWNLCGAQHRVESEQSNDGSQII